MKRTILITLLLTLGIAPCLSQTDELKEINLQHTQSIIREWNAGNAVAFLYNPYGTSYFCLESSSTPTTVLSAEVPRNVRIYDFKILDDTLYFCGTKPINGEEYGIVGFFDIDNLFNHGGSCTYGEIYVPVVEPRLDCRMSRPWRMDVYRFGGFTHIVAVGENELSTITPGILTSTTILDAYFDGTVWHGSQYMNKYNDEYYTDIATTDQYVVATAQRADGNACYLRAFHQSSSLLSTPVNYGYVVEVVDDRPEGKILIDHTTDDQFVIAYYLHDGSHAFHSLKSFQMTTAAPLYTALQYSLKLVQNPNSGTVPFSWNLQDLCYNPKTRHVSILQDMDYPVGTSTLNVIEDYNLTSAPAGLAADFSWVDSTRFFAIDGYWDIGVRAIGDNYGPIVIFGKKAIGHRLCNHLSVYNYFNNTQTVSTRLVEANEVRCSPRIRLNYHTPVVRKTNATISCRHD